MREQRNIVPFGKYKGQPVEIMAADTPYCEWLRAQPWFAEKFRDVYNIVINYGAEPDDTPEHNALQARFLEEEFCRVIVATAKDKEIAAGISGAVFEVGGFDVAIRTLWGESCLVECKPSLGDDYPSVLRQIKGYRMLTGDFRVLLVGSFSARGATLDQVRKIFDSSGIRLVMLEEVLAVMKGVTE